MARILVIDDHAGVRALLKQMLTLSGHEVVLAEDSRDGVRQCCHHPANAVIADFLEDDYERVETLLELRRNCPEVPIIAMSAGGTTATLTVARTLGAVAILEKPFFLSQLRGAVDKALGL